MEGCFFVVLRWVDGANFELLPANDVFLIFGKLGEAGCLQ